MVPLTARAVTLQDIEMSALFGLSPTERKIGESDLAMNVNVYQANRHGSHISSAEGSRASEQGDT